MKVLATACVEVLSPLRLAATDQRALGSLLRDLGWPDAKAVSFDDIGPLAGVPGLIDSAEALVVTLADGDDDAAAAAIVQTLDIVADVMAAVDALRTWDPVDLVPVDLRSGTSVADLADALPGLLVSRWLEVRAPAVLAMLLLLGVIVEENVDRAVGPPARRIRFNWAMLAAAFDDPAAAIAGHYQWAPGSEWRHGQLLEYVRRLLTALGLPARHERINPRFIGSGPAALYGDDQVPPGTLELAVPIFRGVAGIGSSSAFAEVGLLAVPAPSEVGGVVDGLVLTNLAYGAAQVGVDLGAGWLLTIQGSLDATGALQLRLRPDENPELVGAAPDSGVAFTLQSPALGATILGDADGSHLSIGSIAATIGLDITPLPGVSFSAELLPAVGVDHGVLVVIDPGGSDGFLASVLGDVAIEAGFDLGVAWTAADGFGFMGGGSLTIELPLNVAIGPIELHGLTVAVSTGSDVLVRVEAGASISGVIGPIQASVDGLGITGSLMASTDPAMIQLGDLGINLGVKPPTGIGLGLDLGVAKGGGFLNIDAAAGLYEGAIQLEVMSVGISAFVIIETKRPDVDGWSMMMALYIEIPAIQLGFGFTLSGVGGLAGINRGIDAEALGDAVRSGSLDTMLFPDDPIADAPIIIDTLASIFPASDSQYVFGPVVKIGWGTPTLVEISVGVVIELPDPIRIAILGSVSALLPRPEVPLVELHLDVAGIIDFEAGTIAIDASLHHSTIVGFNIAGDMALRAGFKDDPTFLFSLGGFHPDFEPPAGFPALQRLSIGLNAGPVFRVTFECYIAITSNTVQFGAALEIVARVAGFGIEGGFEFDALIQFNPFRLRVSMGLHISVTAAGVDLMGVWLHGQLDGPNAWHIAGSAEFKVLGIKKSINVDELIGTAENELPEPTPDLLGMLVEALELEDAWAAGASPSDGVSFADPEVDPTRIMLLIGPHGTIEVGQNVVPLAQTIDKFGNADELDHHHFTVAAGSGLVTTAAIQNWFSPGHYTDLDNREKLAAPSFEEMDAGIVFGGGVSAGPARAADMGYEPIVVDTDYEAWELANARPRVVADSLLLLAEPFGATVSAGLLGNVTAAVIDGSFGVAQPEYVVTDALTGAPVGTAGTFMSSARNLCAGHVLSMTAELT